MKTKKTILAALTAVCAMTLTTSCTREDNPVVPTSGKTVVTIDPAALYDELKVTKQMSAMLESGAMTIRDSVLVYDQSGSLLTKLGVETSTLQPVTIETGDLPNGTYTLVVWQSANSDGVQAYNLAGEEQLSTVSVRTTLGNLGYMWAVGCTAVTVGIEGGSLEASVSPKSLGSIIQIYVDNLTATDDYVRARLIGSNAQYIVGCRLDPSLSDDERWIFEREHNWNESVGNVPSTTNFNRYFVLSHGDVKYYLYGEKSDGSSVLVGSGDHYLDTGDYAVFYLDLASTVWQPTFFGTVQDFVVWKAERDEGMLVNKPLMNWGCNADEVRQYVKTDYQWSLALNDEPTVVRNGYWTTRYYLAGLFVEEYDFETADGQNLKRVLDICYDPSLTLEMANASLLKQGYLYKGILTIPGYPSYDVFFSPDGKIEVQTVPGNNRMTILYQPTDPEDLPYITPADEVVKN